jgi:hypothetical protein
MKRRILISTVIAGMTLFLASASWADVPAPPVNQDIGMVDVALGDLTESECRICHDSGVPDRHHLLYGSPIPPGSLVPYPDADGDGNPDTVYACLNCHDQNFTVVRDCLACHTGASPHHTTPDATNRNCVACHGDLVDNYDDGHYIPSYAPSLVTPARSGGAGLPLNSRGNGAGACNYCHDDDGLPTPVILTNQALHHGTGLSTCSWCHDFAIPFAEQIRVCEDCHGPDSLHNIQADSPKVPTGTIVVGGEDAGYGHVGRDAGPSESDCWGCHGFAMSFAPWSGPVTPTVYGSDRAAIDAGTDTSVTLTGSAFTNIAGDTLFESAVALTAADGSSVTLTPDSIGEGDLTVTIPGDTTPGNYSLQAVKTDAASNPAVISVKPQVTITGATGKKTVTITGSGFGGFAAGSGTSVITIKNKGKKKASPPEEAGIISWSDTKIEAEFRSRPKEVTVNSVFGSATSKVGKPAKPPKKKKEKKKKNKD